jgi:hypothetical protein
MNYNDFIKEIHNIIDNEIECNYVIVFDAFDEENNKWWSYSEILTVNEDLDYEWLNDWYEGEQYHYTLDAIIPVSDLHDFVNIIDSSLEAVYERMSSFVRRWKH